MFGNFCRRAFALTLAAAAVALAGVPAFALPPTGDSSSTVIPIVVGLLALSVVLILVYVILSAKKKKGR